MPRPRALGAALFLLTIGTSLASVHYVDLNSTNATPPYTNWSTAATNIQDAVDAAVAGDEVVVTNGYYAAGFGDGGPNGYYVEVDKALNIRSVNGPYFTAIDGGGETFQLGCVLLMNEASLSGFTLLHGFAALGHGGGASGGILNNCALTGNSAYFGGGGATSCTLNNCTLTGNSASYGGGASDCILNNCTLSGNSASGTAQGTRGGAAGCIENNCIFFGNSHRNPFPPPSSLCEDCGSPGHLAGNNWNGDPLFQNTNGWANLRLQPNSPCINAGNNAYAPAGPDLDGNPRIVGGTVDIGAYEFQSPVSQISYAWLQQYGLPINAATDSADPDGDAVDNYHEWLAGTNPTNALSSPAQLTITPSGVPPSGILLTWSTNAVGFTLQSTINLLSPAAWVTNSATPAVINGQNTVTNPTSGPQQSYRLKQ